MNRIKLIRNTNGIKQADLAKYLNIAPNTLSTWETNQIEPSNEGLKKIAEYFHTTTDYILGLTNNSKPTIDSVLTIKETNAENINNSVVANGHNSTAINGLSKEEADILKIYREFDFDKRLKFLNLLADLKE